MIRFEAIGRIGKDAEVKDFGGNQVINFTIAVSEKYKDKSGNMQETTTWISVAKWGNNTALAQYIKKGDMIYVSGKPNNRAYLAPDGTAKVDNGITAFEIQLLGSKQEGAAPAAQAPQSHNAVPMTPAASFKEEDHDDLPFN